MHLGLACLPTNFWNSISNFNLLYLNACEGNHFLCGCAVWKIFTFVIYCFLRDFPCPLAENPVCEIIPQLICCPLIPVFLVSTFESSSDRNLSTVLCGCVFQFPRAYSSAVCV